MHCARQVPLRDIAAGYLRIGSTSFGMAMMPQIRTLVTKPGWLTQEEFRDGTALVQVYPGPFIVDLAAYTGYRLRGVRGALVAASCLILPAFVSMVVLSAVYFELGTVPSVQRFLVGLEALLIGILLQLTLDLGARHVRSQSAAVLAVLGFAALLFNVNPALVVVGALGAGIVLYYARRSSETDDEPPTAPAVQTRRGRWLPIGIAGSMVMVAAIMAWLWEAPLGAMTLGLLKIGSIAFGGVATIAPMLQSEVTQLHQWLTPREFIDGLALGQATPGPPVVTAAFTGYKLGGVVGAALATCAIFAPSVVMTMLFTELLERFRGRHVLEPLLASIMAAFVGLLAGMTLQLGMAALRGPAELTLAAAAFAAAQVFRLDAIWVFGGGLGLWALVVVAGG